MITEVIKRGHRKGYDENGVLVYKIPVDEPSPATVEEVEVEEDEAAPTFPFIVGK